MYCQRFYFLFYRLLPLWWRLVLAVLVLLISACSPPAYLSIDEQAGRLGFVRSTAQGKGFRHVVYAPARQHGGDTVNVYIEGDGVNWQWNRFVKTDPTPSRGLMLEMMGLDRGNTVYVGRPCYFGLELDDACRADFWTYARYSEKVVMSMAAVITAETQPYTKVVLIGHSGGGALALLLAEHLSKVTAIVTIAGNIDTDAWVQHHGYTPLYRSLNPAGREPLPATIKQLHVVGGQDQNIPLSLVQSWVERQPAAELRVIPDNSHLCCWKKDWTAILRWIESLDSV